MHGALATLGCVAALMTSGSAFVMPGPSHIISGRSTRASTSQVIVMGRGDTRTPKGKRMRHSYGKCRPRKPAKSEPEGKAAPVARRWENIEYVESEIVLPSPSASDDAADEAAEDAADVIAAAPEAEVEEAVEEVAAPAEPFVSSPESVAAQAAEEPAPEAV